MHITLLSKEFFKVEDESRFEMRIELKLALSLMSLLCNKRLCDAPAQKCNDCFFHFAKMLEQHSRRWSGLKEGCSCEN